MTTRNQNSLYLFGLSCLYFVTHLIGLAALPVFADEAIYIRWAQLIIDDWRQYLFFPMNDGKTPLFIWSLIPFQFLIQDQLIAARLVSVLVGFVQLFVAKEVVRLLGGRQKTQYLAMLLVLALPFWYFYHRMALMDSMLTLGISLAFCAALRSSFAKTTKGKLLWVVALGLSFGASIWIKMPALFLAPGLLLVPLIQKGKLSVQHLIEPAIRISVGIFIGCCIFALLRLSPSFGQLFRRSSDFTFPISEVLLQGKWRETLSNIPSYINYFGAYLTLPVLLLSIAGIFSQSQRRKTLVLLATATIFALPFVVFGRTIYARYFLPSVFFLTISAVLAVQALYDRWTKDKTGSQLAWKNMIGGSIVIVLLANTFAASAVFATTAIQNPDQLQLVSSDRAQYLEDWSSGHGIAQTVAYIRKQQSAGHTIAVATEGRFGTLPDALLLYVHGTSVQGIDIEGTGDYPVKYLHKEFTDKAKKYDQSILVVNSNRMEIPLAPSAKIAEYCRPNHAACLQVWDITKEVKAAK